MNANVSPREARPVPHDADAACQCQPWRGPLARWMRVESGRARANSVRDCALLNAIGDALPDLIYAKDLEGRLIYASRGVRAAFGTDYVVGRPPGNQSHPAEAAAHAANDARVIATGDKLVCEEAFTGRDGVRRLFRSIKVPLRDASGELFGVAGFTRDLAAERARERELELDAAHRRLAGAITLSAWAAEAGGDFEFIDEARARLARMGRADLEDARDLVIPLDLAGGAELWEKAVQTAHGARPAPAPAHTAHIPAATMTEREIHWLRSLIDSR